MSTERAVRSAFRRPTIVTGDEGGYVPETNARFALGTGADSPEIPDLEFTPSVRRVVAALSDEVEALRDELARTRLSLEDAEFHADRDQLLPILNRRAFMRELARQIAAIARYRTPATLIYFDLDDLKRINDSFGHACGDVVLAHFSGLLLTHVRKCDVVGRLGGDEFGVILTHADANQAQRKSAILAALLASDPPIWEGRPLACGFSFGTLELPVGIDAETAVAQADAAMYRHKRRR
jgi:diguanylate cyclase (GGDEF)-like protein